MWDIELDLNASDTDDEDVDGRFVQDMVGRVGLDAAHDVHPAEDLAEDDVAGVAPWCGHGRDEELRGEESAGGSQEQGQRKGGRRDRNENGKGEGQEDEDKDIPAMSSYGGPG